MNKTSTRQERIDTAIELLGGPDSPRWEQEFAQELKVELNALRAILKAARKVKVVLPRFEFRKAVIKIAKAVEAYDSQGDGDGQG